MVTLLMLTLGAAPEAWRSTPMPGPMPPPQARAWVDLAGFQLAYATYGAGPPVILLHGGAGNGDHWANQVPALAKQFTVIVVDSRGHGRSTRPPDPLSYEEMADDVLALMDRLGLDRAAVVGWSDGGATALSLAVSHPERVTRLVVYGTNANPSGLKRAEQTDTFTAYFARCAADYARLSPTPKGYQDLLAVLRPMWRTQPDFTAAQLVRITAPTLVLAGDHDELLRPEHLRWLAQAIPHAKLVLVPDASHFALFQQPVAFNRVLLEFLRAKD